MKNSQVAAVLKSVGLKMEMSFGSFRKENFDPELFTCYFIRGFRTEHEEEMDHIYGFSDEWLLHKPIGLRMLFSVHEHYFGEVDYKCYKTFIITKKGDEVPVMNIDFEKETFITPEGRIPFSTVDKRLSDDCFTI